MKFIKHSVKKLLVHRQHREYDKMVAERNLSYDKWIQIQEKTLQLTLIFQKLT